MAIFACIPIVETAVSVTTGRSRLVGHCEKRPALVLVFRNGVVIGLDLAGRRRDLDEIEGTYPGAISKAQARLNKASGLNDIPAQGRVRPDMSTSTRSERLSMLS